MVFLSGTVIVQQYFTKRRPLAAGIAFSGLAVGTVIVGPLIQWCINMYGWRGALLIMAGIFLNCAVCGALFRPLPEVTKLAKSNVIYIPSKEAESNANAAMLNDNQDNVLHEENAKSPFKDMCDFSLLGNMRFFVFCSGTLLLNFGVMAFIQHSPGRALTYGIDRNRITFLPMTLGLSTAIFTVIFGYVATFNIVSRPTQYAVAVIAGGFLVISYGLATTFPTFVTWSAAMGFAHGQYSHIFILTIIK